MKSFLNIISKGFINLLKSLGYIALCIFYLPCYLLGLLFSYLTTLTMDLMHKLW